MTPEKIKEGLAAIEAVKNDPERAHSLEDTMYAAILESISRGCCEQPEECARLALTSREIDFPRWCA